MVIYWNFKGNKAERVADILSRSCMTFMVVSDFKKLTHEREFLVTCVISKCERPDYATTSLVPIVHVQLPWIDKVISMAL